MIITVTDPYDYWESRIVDSYEPAKAEVHGDVKTLFTRVPMLEDADVLIRVMFLLHFSNNDSRIV